LLSTPLLVASLLSPRSSPLAVVLFLKSVKTSCKIQDVLKFLERNKIDAVIPADISDTFFLCSHLPSIQEHTKIALCPAVETYESLEDKWRTYNFCLDNGIATPETKKLEDVDELEFPFFLKVRWSKERGKPGRRSRGQGRSEATARAIILTGILLASLAPPLFVALLLASLFAPPLLIAGQQRN